MSTGIWARTRNPAGLAARQEQATQSAGGDRQHDVVERPGKGVLGRLDVLERKAYGAVLATRAQRPVEAAVGRRDQLLVDHEVGNGGSAAHVAVASASGGSVESVVGVWFAEDAVEGGEVVE